MRGSHTHTPHRRTLDHGQPKDVSLPETLVGDDLEKEVLTAGVMLKREREGRGGEVRGGGEEGFTTQHSQNTVVYTPLL